MSKRDENNEPKPEEVPKSLIEKDIKTTFRNMSDIIKEKLDQLKDLATMEVMLPVDVRMRKRLESLKEMGSAKHWKINGYWKDDPPQMHIRGLEGRKHDNSKCEIRFSVYATDEAGRKKEFKNYGEVEQEDGKMKRKHLSSEYKIAYEVIETILDRKPITRDILRVNENKEVK